MIDLSSFVHNPGTESRHQCLIYSGAPSQKLSIIAGIIQDKLNEGYRCLYLNSPPMVAGLRSTLAAMDMDVAELVKDKLILSSDTVSPGNRFNAELMLNNLESHLDQAISDGYKGLWASGDMTWEFGPDKDFSSLMEYEIGLEGLFHKRPELCGICQYHQESLPKEAMRKSLLIHPTIVITETLKIVNPHYLKSNRRAEVAANERLDAMIAELCREQA